MLRAEVLLVPLYPTTATKMFDGCLKPSNFVPGSPQFYMNGHLLESSTTAKLLGVTIDSRLTFSHHIDNMCNSLASRLYAMRELKRLGLNSSGLLLYYTANIRSLVTYACPVWGTIISDHHQHRITQIERRALKIMNPDISYNEAIGNQIYSLWYRSIITLVIRSESK